MSDDDATTILQALTADAPSLEQHEELVLCAERRHDRAATKFDAAGAELEAAGAYLDQAKRRRAQFIADNPDPQMALL